MANLIRENTPVLHEALEQFLSDPVVFHRYGEAPFETIACPLPPVGEEAVQQGNNLRIFMTLAWCGGSAPTLQDRITKNSVLYRITDVAADDYNGFSLSLRRS